MSKYFLKVECPHFHLDEIYVNPEHIIKVFKIKKKNTSIQFLDDGSRDDGGESFGNFIFDKRSVAEVIAEIEKVMEVRRGLS